MAYETIDFKLDRPIARITLNRPDRLNSFTAQMHAELREVLEAVGDARVIVLTGAGRGFCAGQDLSDRAVAADEHLVDLGMTVETSWNQLIRTLTGLPQPVIARVNSVAAERARTSLSHATSSLRRGRRSSYRASRPLAIPDSGGTWVLPASSVRLGRWAWP